MAAIAGDHGPASTTGPILGAIDRSSINRSVWPPVILLCLCTAISLLASCSSVPDTPENAVIKYNIARQMGKYDTAEQLLCSALAENPLSEATQTIERITDEGNVKGQGSFNETDNEAMVRLAIGFPPFPPAVTHSIDDLMSGRAGSEVREHRDPWIARMVKEDGRWKLCGLEPVEPQHGDRGN